MIFTVRGVSRAHIHIISFKHIGLVVPLILIIVLEAIAPAKDGYATAKEPNDT
jgi:hypothetical protein